MKRRKPAISLGIALLVLGCTISASGATSGRLSGSIGGQVKSATGIAQMGASVVLYNHYDRVIRRMLTGADGSFSFDQLLPGTYSIRVGLASFIPAFKGNIPVQPGFHSVLTINLASMLSSIEFVSAVPAGGLMSDDWKWVLRSSQATRPVLRFVDSAKAKAPRPSRAPMRNAFSETRGIIRVSAGDATSFASAGSTQPDLGTAFALATSLFGSNQLELSGNFGYSSRTGLPVAGFRTKYVHNGASTTPEITMSMHQVYLSARGDVGMAAQDGPSMRSTSVTFLDEIAPSANMRLEYGSSVESVSMWNRLTMVSPFARLTYDLGHGESLQMAYSSGAAPIDLAARGNETLSRGEAPLSQNLSALGMLPPVSIRNSRAEVQRTQNVELGYTKIVGSRTYRAGVYHERVSNGALILAGADELYAGNVLPDLGSEGSVFNIGKFNRWGYVTSVTQTVKRNLEAAVAYGRGGTLTTEGRTLNSADADELRRFLRVHERNWASARVTGVVPVTGTRVSGSYGYADFRSLLPAHLYLAQRFEAAPGVNISIRQPLPSLGGMPGRFEATAELLNLLQQGYLPVNVGSRSLLLTNAPRALRGGLSFIF